MGIFSSIKLPNTAVSNSRISALKRPVTKIFVSLSFTSTNATDPLRSGFCVHLTQKLPKYIAREYRVGEGPLRSFRGQTLVPAPLYRDGPLRPREGK